ncbi:MAG: ATP synthase F1 subunit epsilon [bacterium]
MNKLTLDIVTQEKRLLTVETSRVTVETTAGEITILAGHVPLLSRLSEGLLRYDDDKGVEQVVAIFGGFLELNSENSLSILADSAVRAEDIDEARAIKAQEEAKVKMADRGKEAEFAIAEAALRKTMLELKAAKYGKRSN